jgi:ATP-dependent Clp protease ATP-binding subunit ClpC
VPMGEGVPSKIEDMVCGEVKRAFNPEFLNRLDDIILFTSLVDEDLLAPMSRRAVTPRGTPLICS